MTVTTGIAALNGTATKVRKSDGTLIKLEDLINNFIQGVIAEFRNIEIDVENKDYKTEVEMET